MNIRIILIPLRPRFAKNTNTYDHTCDENKQDENVYSNNDSFNSVLNINRDYFIDNKIISPV